MKKLINYIQDVKSELTKVTWPKKDEVVKLTLTVFIFSAIVAFFVGGLDLIFTNLLTKVLQY